MSESTFKMYLLPYFENVPWAHISVICILVIILFFWLRKRYTFYRAFVCCFTFFFSILLLYAMVFIRFNGNIPYSFGSSFSSEFHRNIQGGEGRWLEIWCNAAIFIPLGFCLSEFLLISKRFSTQSRLCHVAIYASMLSLSIECLQLFLRLGLFELTDMVMNTVGALIGAGMASLIRLVLEKTRDNKVADKNLINIQ